MKNILLSLVICLTTFGCQRAPSGSPQSHTTTAATPQPSNLRAQAEYQQQQINAAGIVISDSSVQSDIEATIRSEFGGDAAAFERELSAQGYTLTQYREVRRSLLAARELHARTATNAPNK